MLMASPTSGCMDRGMENVTRNSSQVVQIFDRIPDPAQAARLKREYEDLQCWFLEQRTELGRDYNRKLSALYEQINTATSRAA